MRRIWSSPLDLQSESELSSSCICSTWLSVTWKDLRVSPSLGAFLLLVAMSASPELFAFWFRISALRSRYDIEERLGRTNGISPQPSGELGFCWVLRCSEVSPLASLSDDSLSSSSSSSLTRHSCPGCLDFELVFSLLVCGLDFCFPTSSLWVEFRSKNNHLTSRGPT